MLGNMIYMATGKLVGKLPVPETAQVARNIAAQGMVLLKNDGTLPVQPQKVALFGVGAEDTVVCGTGSGYAFSPYTVSVRQGLENAGFEITSDLYFANYKKLKKQMEKSSPKLSIIDKRFSGIRFMMDAPQITAQEMDDAKVADIAVYVVCRNTGENFDRKAEKGDYYLTDVEEANIRMLTKVFAHTVVILNTCVIDAAILESIPGISSIVLMGQAGLESGNALADILTGKVTPSGKLTDTWAKRYEDYPASATFSTNDGVTLQEDYTEDIFVGYRHFDTAKLDVVYPFGYGLSYTTFDYQNIRVAADWNRVTVELVVANTGTKEGREIVQVYASAPAGRLPKPFQELRGYEKTKILSPGEKVPVKIEFPTETLASYDESKAAWIMEPGDYLIRVGKDSRHTEIAAVLRLDGEAVLFQLSNQLKPDHELELRGYPVPDRGEISADIINLTAIDCVTVDSSSKIECKSVTYQAEGVMYTIPERKFKFPIECKEMVKTVRSCPSATLLDVKAGRVSMEEFVASLDTETLLRIITGIGSETKHPVLSRIQGKIKFNPPATAASGKTTSQYANSLGIPGIALADGPAGLHLTGEPSTGYPVGMVVAQCWDLNAAYCIGNCFGKEMEYYHATIILGPGMNIHRDPLCGRNFEYYSEDPLLTGKTAAAFTRGLQENHPGYGVAIKHFAANNQETDRINSNATISERALREIYLKGFEICVKEAKPMTVMSSYNLINGQHTSSCYELLTDILRGEWGFEGFVMTDWDSQSEKPFDFHAGNDIIMGGYPTDVIAAAISGKNAQFDKDGAVHQDKIAMYGGIFNKMVDAWGCFAPEAGGKDSLKVIVAADVKLSARVEQAVKEGIAEVTELADGSKKVIYTGTNRGAYLPLGDIQRSAIRVLSGIMNSAQMKTK